MAEVGRLGLTLAPGFLRFWASSSLVTLGQNVDLRELPGVCR